MKKIIYVGRSKLFEVKLFYKVLHGGGVADFPWKSIWKVKTPLKVVFFLDLVSRFREDSHN